MPEIDVEVVLSRREQRLRCWIVSEHTGLVAYSELTAPYSDLLLFSLFKNFAFTKTHQDSRLFVKN